MPRDLEVQHLPPKPPRHRYLSERQARFHPVKNNNFTATFARSWNGMAAEGEGEIEGLRWFGELGPTRKIVAYRS